MTVFNRWGAVLASFLLPACSAPTIAPPKERAPESAPRDDVVRAPARAPHEAAPLPPDDVPPGIAAPACREIAPVPKYEDWPRVRSPLRKDAEQERFIRQIV